MKRILLISMLLCAMVIPSGAQQAPTADGTWLGTLNLPAARLRLGVILSGTSGPEASGILNSIDQGGVNIPLDRVEIAGDSLVIASVRLGLVIRGKLNDERTA